MSRIAPLLAATILQTLSGTAMAAAPSPTPLVAHCTGRFDYALPATFVSNGSQQSLYLIDASFEPWLAGQGAAEAWKTRLAKASAPARASTDQATPAREFELRAIGPAAWMSPYPDRPDLVTLLAMRPIALANQSLFLSVEASAGREPIAEKVVAEVAESWVPNAIQGFCTGAGAFVVEPSMNERANAGFDAPGVSLSIQTETVSAPDDGRSSGGDLPPGGKRLLDKRREVGGLKGREERARIPDDGKEDQLIYTWIFAGRAAAGAMPRIRLEADAPASKLASLDTAWEALLSSWHLRPLGVK